MPIDKMLRLTPKKKMGLFLVILLLATLYIMTGGSCVDKIKASSGIDIKAYTIRGDGSFHELSEWGSFFHKQTITDVSGNPLVGVALCPFLTFSKTNIGTESDVDIIYSVSYASKNAYGGWQSRVERPNDDMDPNAWVGQDEYNYTTYSGSKYFWRKYHPNQTKFWLEDPAVKYSALCPAGFQINGFSPFVMVFDESFFNSVCSYNEAFWVSKLNMQEGATTDVKFTIEVSVRRNGIIEKIAVGTATFQIIYTTGGDGVNYDVSVDFEDWDIDNPSPPPTDVPPPDGDVTNLQLTTNTTNADLNENVTFTATLKTGGTTPSVIPDKRVDVIEIETGYTIFSGMTDSLGRIQFQYTEQVQYGTKHYVAYFWGDTEYNGCESNQVAVNWGSINPPPPPP